MVEDTYDEDEFEMEEKIEETARFTFKGKKYLKSTTSNIVYEENLMDEDGNNVVLGKWNEKTNTINAM